MAARLAVGGVLPGWEGVCDGEDTDLTQECDDGDDVGECVVCEFDHRAGSPSELSVRAGDLLYAVIPCALEQTRGRYPFVEGTRMSDGVRGRVPSNRVRPLTPANTNTSHSGSAPHASSSTGTHTDVTRGQTSANVGLAALFGQEVGSAGSIEGPPLLFGDEGADTVLDRWLGFGVLRPFSQCCNSLTILNRVPAVTGYHLSLAGLCVSSLHGVSRHTSMTDASRWRGGYSYTPTPSPPAADAASATSIRSHTVMPTAAAAAQSVGTQAGLSWRVKRAIESSATPPSAAAPPRSTPLHEQSIMSSPSSSSSSSSSPSPPPSTLPRSHPFPWSVSSRSHAAAVDNRGQRMSSSTCTRSNRRVRGGQQNDTLFAECNPFRTTSTTAPATISTLRARGRAGVPATREYRDEAPSVPSADVVDGRHANDRSDVFSLVSTENNADSAFHARRDVGLLHMEPDDAGVSASMFYLPSCHGADAASHGGCATHELQHHHVTDDSNLVTAGDGPSSPRAPPPPLVLPPLPDTWQMTPAATARALRAWLDTATNLRTNSESAVMAWHRDDRSASVDDVMTALAMYQCSSTCSSVPTRRPKEAAAAESRRSVAITNSRMANHANASQHELRSAIDAVLHDRDSRMSTLLATNLEDADGRIADVRRMLIDAEEIDSLLRRGMHTERPDEHHCPITACVMEDPVMITSCGDTFERSAITRWFAVGDRSCPICRQSAIRGALVPNKALKRLIDDWSDCNTDEAK